MSKAELLTSHQESVGPHEACGITAIFSKTGQDVVPFVVSMQNNLQHRGRDSAGMAVSNSGSIINTRIGLGKVLEVFPKGFDFKANNLSGDRAIGHNRYGTSGDAEKDNADGSQPAVVQWQGQRVAVAYNGNLPEKERIKLRLKLPKDMPKSPNFDTFDIANAIVSAEGNNWEEKIKNGMEGVKGAYSLTILTDKGEIFGLRGPSGHWPLWVGETDDRIIFASETRADASPDIVWTEVMPGELVKATQKGVIKKIIYASTSLFRCALHDAYGAKPDSLMTKDATYKDFRKQLGRELAKEHPLDADLYIGVPETGLPIADGYAEELGKTALRLIKSNGVRSFIAPTVGESARIVDGKYEIEDSEQIEGKNVMLIDDSLIRGKTMGGDPTGGMKGVIGLVRAAGAKEVHLGTALAKFVKGCDMGYYIKRNQLIALVKKDDGMYEELDEEAIAQRIGADSVHFLSIEGIKNAYGWAFGDREVACMACMGEPHPLDMISKTS